MKVINFLVLEKHEMMQKILCRMLKDHFGQGILSVNRVNGFFNPDVLFSYFEDNYAEIQNDNVVLLINHELGYDYQSGDYYVKLIKENYPAVKIISTSFNPLFQQLALSVGADGILDREKILSDDFLELIATLFKS